MTHRLRTLGLAVCLLASAAALTACGSSGSDTGSASTTRAAPASTSSTIASTTTMDATASTTTVAGSAGAVDCQALLQEYTDRFTMDDLADAAAFFREYAPSMPEDVGAASLRIADAYDEADGDPANLDFSDVDLTADAQTFSDWTNDGCPAG